MYNIMVVCGLTVIMKMRDYILRVTVVATVVVTVGVSAHAAWTPAETNTAVWYDASDVSTVLTNGNSVTNWLDKSGNALNASQATGTRQPAYGSRTINGRNVIAFDGVNDYMAASSLNQSQPYTAFFLARTTFGGGRDYVFDGITTETKRNLVALNISKSVDFFGGSWGGSAVSTPIDPVMVAAAFNTSSSEISVNGANTTGYDVGSHNPTNGIHLGCNSTPNNHWLEGDIGEFLIVDGAPDTATRQKVEGYLAHKWGLQDDLPSDHPYKHRAPGVPVGTVIVIR